jgi:hypothetical protein
VQIKSIEVGSAARRCGRLGIGDSVHSIQGIMCHEKTLLEMDDYIMCDYVYDAHTDIYV